MIVITVIFVLVAAPVFVIVAAASVIVPGASDIVVFSEIACRIYLILVVGIIVTCSRRFLIIGAAVTVYIRGALPIVRDISAAVCNRLSAVPRIIVNFRECRCREHT